MSQSGGPAAPPGPRCLSVDYMSRFHDVRQEKTEGAGGVGGRDEYSC